MAIRVVMPRADVTFNNLIGLLQDIAIHSEANSVSATRVTGTGKVDGLSYSYVATGSGFNDDITRGTLQTMDVKIDGVTVSYSKMGLSISAFSTAVLAEENGRARAIEQLLLGQDWNVSFKGGDDRANEFDFVGDGAAFNPRGNDVFRLGAGNDDVFLGSGSDKAWGVAGQDNIVGGAGNDSIYGGRGGDTLKGGGGRDVVEGGGGNDFITGGSKADVINGGKGRDYLVGGAAGDDFIFVTGDGRDTIEDFNARNNAEDIDLSGVDAITGWNDLRNNHLDVDGGVVVIEDGEGLRIKLLGVDLTDLHKADFIF